MPVEIKELIIRAIVESEQQAPQGQSAAAGSESDYDETRIIESCVNQVLRILRRSRER